MMETPKILRMSFDPHTIEHLGIKMYSQIPSAIAELIANSYDADASLVEVRLYDDGKQKRIEVVDDGIGMGFDDLNTKFLRIGRNRRSEGAKTSPNGRVATGKKGLGKLALFGLGDLIDVTTKKRGENFSTSFSLDWNALIGTVKDDYLPKFKIDDNVDKNSHGTSVVLRNLRRASPFNSEALASSLARLFNCFSNSFRCRVSLNDKDHIEVDTALRVKSIDIQFEWNFPKFATEMKEIYEHKEKISGQVVSTHKPLRPGLRGITLFANGRQVNTPEFFGLPESSHVFSYITGWLNVDFVDDLVEDVISTNRQSLNWELPQIERLQAFLVAALRKIISEWREKRKQANREELPKIANVNTGEWLGTMTDQIRNDVEALVESVVNETDVSAEKQAEVLNLVHKLVPDYPQYHWRHMHPEVQKVSELAYKAGDYYAAFMEAVKRYTNTIKKYTGRKEDDHPLMGAVFGAPKDGVPKALAVSSKYKRPDGSNFNEKTLDNIETGQRELSQGIISGCRNPVAHEEAIDLRESNLFSEKDCLDALSILSHLFRRLDDALEANLPNKAG